MFAKRSVWAHVDCAGESHLQKKRSQIVHILPLIFYKTQSCTEDGVIRNLKVRVPSSCQRVKTDELLTGVSGSVSRVTWSVEAGLGWASLGLKGGGRRVWTAAVTLNIDCALPLWGCGCAEYTQGHHWNRCGFHWTHLQPDTHTAYRLWQPTAPMYTK